MRPDAARNRAQIQRAARDLVAASGPDVSMDAIAAQAGVAVGTLYRHYPTKADLVAAVLDESIEQFAVLAEATVGRVGAGGDLAGELAALFAAFVELKVADQALKAASARLGIPVPGADLTGLAEGSGTHRAALAAGTLLRIGQERGLVRPDVTLADLGMLLFSAPGADTDPAMRARYVEIMLAGLRAP